MKERKTNPANNRLAEAMDFLNQVRRRLNSSDDYSAFLNSFYCYNLGLIGKIQLKELGDAIIGKYPDLLSRFNDFFEHCNEHGRFLAQQERNGRDKKEKKKEKEIDLSTCQFVTPNYLLLPKDYVVNEASGRLEIDAQVLNDNLICACPGERLFKNEHKNDECEEVVFKCEDQRCEVDVLLNLLKSAEENVEEFLNGIKENEISLKTQFLIGDYLSVLTVKCIEKMYDEKADGVLEKLSEDPLVVLPIILSRLRQKVEEATGLKSEWEKIWVHMHIANQYT